MSSLGSPEQHTTNIIDVMRPLTTTVGTTEDNSQEQDGETATTSTSSVARTPITITKILKHIDDGDAKSILVNKNLHYFF